MREYNTDIVIFGAGIAGLWTLGALRRRGYSALLLENNAIGAGQTIASQGIIHSGLKYALSGKVSTVAKGISSMPQRWKDELKNDCATAPSHQLFIPKGLMGGIIKLATMNAFGNVRELKELPPEIKAGGFDGSIIAMDEPVLDIPKVLKEMAAPYKDSIRKIYFDALKFTDAGIEIAGHVIKAKCFIFTAAGSNDEIARRFGHDQGLKTQVRPLLMGMMKNAPFSLYAHFVGKSDKPIATITTHKTKDGALVWYVGGSIAERAKDSNPEDVYEATREAFKDYMPDVDLSKIEWAVLPIDRMEGTSGSWMPDTPTIHQAGNALYCWPTKLTFAPLMADMILEKIKDMKPSDGKNDWSFLPEAGFAEPPWNTAVWKK